MIGNIEDATTAFNKHIYRKRPKGWKKVGEGCSRSAYLSPDGVVYKVAHYGDYNEKEHQAFKRYRKWKSLNNMNVYIPDSSLYKIAESADDDYVIAMEYIEKKHSMYCKKSEYPFDKGCTCNPVGRMCYDDLMMWLSDRGMEDMWYGNIIHSADNKFYVIDLGHNER